jgi:alkaline phosphatase D
MDTRRYRSDVKTNDEASRTMLGENQRAAFFNWLVKVRFSLFFVGITLTEY